MANKTFESVIKGFSSVLDESEDVAKGSDLIICPKPIEKINNRWKVFLAGPIQGAPHWQFEMPTIDNVVYFSPRRKKYPDPTFNYDEQVAWETLGLHIADVVLFWIPEPDEEYVKENEGRSYAQTTRFELGEYIALGKKVIVGGYKEFPGFKYYVNKAKKYKNILGVYNTLDECLDCLKKYMSDCESNPQTYFTADTHFGSKRTLELSQRPFADVNEMDEVLMTNWNDRVKPCDTIYHLGDFGERTDLTQYLNGNKIFVYGNYERDEKSTIEKKWFDEVSKKPIVLTEEKLVLCHEPLTAKKYVKKNEDADFAVFGHIHGRQKVKEFGIDCGVDANNYRPISLDEVKFLKNAVEKGFYDEEVWS